MSTRLFFLIIFQIEHIIFSKKCSVISNDEKKWIVAINFYDQNSIIVNFGREFRSNQFIPVYEKYQILIQNK